MKFTPIDWSIYNKPPYFPQWLSRGETKKLASYDDRLLADIDRQIGRLSDLYDLDTIKGILLDRLGKLVAEYREGNDDELYRIIVKLRVLLNTADGTVNNLIKVIKFFYSSEKVEIVPDYPAGLRIYHDGEGPPINFNRIIKEVIAAGVSYDTREIMGFHDFEEMTSTQKLIVHTGYSEFIPATAIDTLAINLTGFNFLDVFGSLLILDGSWRLDGSKMLSGVRSEAVEKTAYKIKIESIEYQAISEDFSFYSGHVSMLESVSLHDQKRTRLSLAGVQESFGEQSEALSVGIRNHHFLDGSWVLDGETLLDGMMLIPLE